MYMYMFYVLPKLDEISFVGMCNMCVCCVGVMRSLTDSFKAIRGSRIDRYVIETNKLLIRLDKLVNADINLDPGKRKGLVISA